MKLTLLTLAEERRVYQFTKRKGGKKGKSKYLINQSATLLAVKTPFSLRITTDVTLLLSIAFQQEPVAIFFSSGTK